jgi:hypothetical protein
MSVAGRAIDANADKSTDRKTHRNRAILRTDAGAASSSSETAHGVGHPTGTTTRE